MTFDQLSNQGYEVSSHYHAATIIREDFPGVETAISQIIPNFSASLDEIVTGGGGLSSIVQRLAAPFYQMGWRPHTFNVETYLDGAQTVARTHEIDHIVTNNTNELGRNVTYTLGLDIEWNTKNTFLNRDLENFRQLHASRGLDVGVIICRGTGFNDDVVALLANYARHFGFRDYRDADHRIAYLANAGVGNNNPTGRDLRKKIATSQRQNMFFEDAWAKRFVESKYGTTTSEFSTVTNLLNLGIGGSCPFLVIGMPARLTFTQQWL